MPGLLTPFQRDKKQDFARGKSSSLLKSKVLQALMTRGTTSRSSGELPWRTAFGSGLDLLRHQRNDDVLTELATVYVKDTLKKWVPEVNVIEVGTKRDTERLILTVRFTSSGNTSSVMLPIDI